MHLPPPTSGLVALLATVRPPCLRGRPELVWCRTPAELIVLLRSADVRAAVVDGRLPWVDGDLLETIGRSCPAIVIDDLPLQQEWAKLGAAAVVDPSSLLDVLEDAIAARPLPPPARPGAPRSGHLIAVLGGPVSDPTTVAATLARSLAHGAADPIRVVLADLSLAAPLAPLLGLDPGRGLPELLAASRYRDPGQLGVDELLQPAGVARHAVLTGLRHPHDWVSVGSRSATTALAALRSRSELVVALVDGDVEGEADTGSFDIEDRNLLARTAVETSELIVVAATTSATGLVGLGAQLRRLAGFGIGADQVLVVVERSRRAGAARSARAARLAVDRALRTDVEPTVLPEVVVVRSAPTRSRTLRSHPVRLAPPRDLVLATTVRARLDRLPPPGAHDAREPVPERVVPGTLGHWAHDVDGWITPSTPQQP